MANKHPDSRSYGSHHKIRLTEEMIKIRAYVEEHNNKVRLAMREVRR